MITIDAIVADVDGAVQAGVSIAGSRLIPYEMDAVLGGDLQDVRPVGPARFGEFLRATSEENVKDRRSRRSMREFS